MTDNNLNIGINLDNIDIIKKRYKKIKKYMKSPMYEIKKLSGKKTIVDKLVEEYEENKNM